jgi:hypothetical protein
MKNKYVTFVSDKEFLNNVKEVLSFYPDIIENKDYLDVVTNSKNTNDVFKTLFDIYNYPTDDLIYFEIMRQYDKTINNKIGEFHQNILGAVDGWVNLGVGDKSEVDLKNEDETIFIELKNKYNTMNSSSEKTCRDKLENIIKNYPNATAYWAYIIEKDYKSKDCIWESSKYNYNSQIRVISGYNVYKLVTGDETAFEQLYDAIPRAIIDIKGDNKLSQGDKDILKKYKTYVFK